MRSSMYGFKMSESGLVAQRLEYTHEQLFSFAANKLCSILELYTAEVRESLRGTQLYCYDRFTAAYVCEFYFFLNGKKVCRCVGLWENKGDLEVWAIAESNKDFDAEATLRREETEIYLSQMTLDSIDYAAEYEEASRHKQKFYYHAVNPAKVFKETFL